MTELDTNDLWRRVGLDELRKSLLRIEKSRERFEQVLRRLPPCNSCARAILLETIQKQAERLSVEAGSTAVLASSIKDTLSVIETAHKQLAAEDIPACCCHQGECTCHD